jgi:hypothetical protein
MKMMRFFACHSIQNCIAVLKNLPALKPRMTQINDEPKPIEIENPNRISLIVLLRARRVLNPNRQSEIIRLLCVFLFSMID